MPIYEYECDDCKLIFEEIRSIELADEPVECGNCSSNRTKRILSKFFSPSNGGPNMSGQSTCGSCFGGNCSACQ